ncbi:LuxR C-terminal-related transcriptional regulator [Microbacterium sp. PMB16]|uniref:helix-turn-helix transcriptional regulator n=1 Tax=Microbacterium sp. PMB16 TaxID=3120157 RepID=UPI003F4BBA85
MSDIYHLQREELGRALHRGMRWIEVSSYFEASATFFLDEIHGSFLAEQWRIVRLSGNRSLSKLPLLPLSVAGLGLLDGGIAPVAADIIQRLSSPDLSRTLLLVDHAQELDDYSLGVLTAAARSAVPGIRLVVTAAGPARERYGLRSGDADLRIRVGPVAFDKIERLLLECLGGPIDETTLSRLFALSGGHPFLAAAIAEASVVGGSLEFIGGEWHSKDRSWSPGLVPIMQQLLTDVDRDQLDALAVLSLSDLQRRSDVAAELTTETLEELEARGLLDERSIGGQPVPLVVPPILAEYFRHEVTPVLHRRLMTHYGDGNLSGVRAHTRSTDEGDAISVRLSHEISRARVERARQLFSTAHTEESATAYLSALLASGLPDHQEMLDAVTDIRARFPLAEMSEPLLRGVAYSVGLVDRQAEYALKMLDDAKSTRTPAQQRALLPVEIEIRLRRERIDASMLELLVPDPDDDPALRARLLELRAYVLCGYADFVGARLALDELAALPESLRTTRWVVAETVCRCAEGDAMRAEKLAKASFQEARRHHDAVALWQSAYALGFARVYMGDLEASIPLLNSMMAMGPPPALCEPEAAAVLSAAEIIGVRMKSSMPHRLSQVAQELRARAIGVLPGTSGEWVRARGADAVLADGHDPDWDAARANWSHGRRMSAVITMTALLERDATSERLSEYLAFLAMIPGLFAAACSSYGRALASGDPADAIVAGDLLQRCGRYALAYEAYVRAFDWATDNETRRSAQQRRARLRSATRTDFDAIRAGARADSLTPREQEVSRLLAANATNVEIAEALHISRRTAETHVYRVLRKLGVATRDEVGVRLHCST